MKRPTLTAALATKGPEQVQQPPEAPNRRTDARINTTLRLEPELLEELKIIAARKRVRVNDLVLDGVRHIVALHRQQSAA